MGTSGGVRLGGRGRYLPNFIAGWLPLFGFWVVVNGVVLRVGFTGYILLDVDHLC